MGRPDVYDEMYQYAKNYIKSNSKYNPTIMKASPQETNQFPLIVIPNCKLIIKDETLKHKEKEYRLIFNIEIYSTDKTVNNKKVAKQSIITELEGLIYDVFEEHYLMRIEEPKPTPNIDRNIDRLSIRATATINEKKIIFRR